MISRATSVYIIMLVIFGAGLWAILSFGSILLSAPTDLAGRWELRELIPSVELTPPYRQMVIEQSGQYFRINLDGTSLSLKRSSEKKVANTSGPDLLTMTLTGSNAELTFIGAPDAEDYQLQVTGTAMPPRIWRATRITRVYPKRAIDLPSTRPTTKTPGATRIISTQAKPTP